MAEWDQHSAWVYFKLSHNICKLREPSSFFMTKEQFIASVTAHYDELNALNKIDNFYDYEGDFIKLWAKRGR